MPPQVEILTFPNSEYKRGGLGLDPSHFATLSTLYVQVASACSHLLFSRPHVYCTGDIPILSVPVSEQFCSQANLLRVIVCICRVGILGRYLVHSVCTFRLTSFTIEQAAKRQSQRSSLSRLY